ncbi:hypothetical protein FJZ33_01390 [Candidatus Poribacteria bacterium]|nr:hypothetical protein [Candidatus Poribacteria bacterium]
MKNRKRIRDLDEGNFHKDSFGDTLIKKLQWDIREIINKVEQSTINKLEAGCVVRSNTVFLHTAPHHDDIMLGYLPFAVRHIRDSSNKHNFAYMTSGFNSVTNVYALTMIRKLSYFLKQKVFDDLILEGYFVPSNAIGRHRDVWQYLDGVAANDPVMKEEGEARRLLRNLMDIYGIEDIENIKDRLNELENYFNTQYPGGEDMEYIQRLKGMFREWEADCLWGYLGFDGSSVKHLRLGFYKGKIFPEEPQVSRDVKPVIQLLKRVNPNVVTVALDPEASGPDTHYKVLQIIAEALRIYEKETGRSNIEVLGYRNVWYRFHPSEANFYVPVSLNMFAVLQNAFMNAFVSQKNASFPSYECDGPFSILAQQIQVQQYQTLKTCLGRSFFNEHPNPLIRATRGFVFLKKMNLQEFYSHARELRKVTEEN